MRSSLSWGCGPSYLPDLTSFFILLGLEFLALLLFESALGYSLFFATPPHAVDVLLPSCVFRLPSPAGAAPLTSFPRRAAFRSQKVWPPLLILAPQMLWRK